MLERKAQSNNSEVKRVAIFRIGHIGDTVVGMSALWTIREYYKNARITMLTQQVQITGRVQGFDVLKPGIVYDEVMSYPFGPNGSKPIEILKALIRLRGLRIQVLAYLPPTRTRRQLDRDRLFFKLAGVKKIVGMDNYFRVDYTPAGKPLRNVPNEADILLDHLKSDGVISVDGKQPRRDIGLDAEERSFAKEWIRTAFPSGSNNLIAVGPGSKMPSKLWPIERYVEVCKSLEDQGDYRFILFGSSAERPLCEVLANQLKSVKNAAGELTVRQSTAIMGHCAMYLGNDTGTMHLAASAGVSCNAIFSARDYPGRWFPYGDRHIAHRVAVECEGCMLEICDKGLICLKNVEPKSVLCAAVDLLTGRRDSLD